mmetsp:Transcript_222/g.578  ORF Transcript_222/g.578 Transcript_222/m.578 type:complete len:209 (-) Transcript_222:108-734(-)
MYFLQWRHILLLQCIKVWLSSMSYQPLDHWMMIVTEAVKRGEGSHPLQLLLPIRIEPFPHDHLPPPHEDNANPFRVRAKPFGERREDLFGQPYTTKPRQISAMNPTHDIRKQLTGIHPNAINRSGRCPVHSSRKWRRRDPTPISHVLNLGRCIPTLVKKKLGSFRVVLDPQRSGPNYTTLRGAGIFGKPTSVSMRTAGGCSGNPPQMR